MSNNLIIAQQDRDFSIAANVGNWFLNSNGTPLSTLLYEGTNPGAEKVGEITFNDDGGASYAGAALANNRWSISANTSYRMLVNIYVPIGNINKTVRLFTSNFDTVYTKIKTIPSNTWTPIALQFRIETDTSGYVNVAFSGVPTTGDIIYFDDVSIIKMNTKNSLGMGMGMSLRF